ncbi:hypothetical protein H0H92_004840 [Tricholoma furcatifolium]|nr:hypothetical protein H0H92_004840 [Tricholoma furcatifolium]
MSSISFPSEQPGSSSNEQGFYASPFEGNASFQMNPLSSHPPRTPRPSSVSSTSAIHDVYGRSVYESLDTAAPPSETTKEELDEAEVEEEHASKPELVRISKEEVWRDLFLASNGRDKAFKLIQYSIRLYLLFHTSVSGSKLLRRPIRPVWDAELVRRLRSAYSGLSFSRAQQSVPFSVEVATEKSKKSTRPFLHTLLYAPPPVLLELVNAISDDAATLSLLGVLGKKFGDRAGRFSDWCWFISTLVGLVENGVERQMIGNLRHDIETRLYSESMTGTSAKSKSKGTKLDEKELMRLQKQDYWLLISRAKLVMDLIFVCTSFVRFSDIVAEYNIAYDLFRIQRFKESIKTITGLTAAILR